MKEVANNAIHNWAACILIGAKLFALGALIVLVMCSI